MSEKFVQLAIPRFDGHYDLWSWRCKTFYEAKNYGRL